MRKPKLRRLERLRIEREGEVLLVLRDPLELCEPFAIDAAYEPVLDALDGQRSVAQVRQSLLMRGIVRVDAEDLEDFVDELEHAGLLDDEHFRARWEAAHLEFVDTEQRLPRRADLLYPADPAQLRSWLAPALPERTKGTATHAGEPAMRWGAKPIALLAPHQPPPRVAQGLRQLLARLPDPSSYRRVVLLATDHAPGLLPHASADKDWVTPLGTLGCDLELLAALDQRLPWLLREQMRLRVSDVLEWTTLLLAALWGPRCPPILPIACGQTRLTTREGAEHGETLALALEELLGKATRAGEVLWWTSAELSHAGPAYGESSLPERETIEALDLELLEPLLEQRASEVAKRCMEREAKRRPSGAAALTTLARMLPSSYRADLVRHELLAAPGQEPGWLGCAHAAFYLGDS